MGSVGTCHVALVSRISKGVLLLRQQRRPGELIEMADTLGRFLLERSRARGLRRIFAYCGDSINDIVAAINRIEAAIDVIQVHHEAPAGFMACALLNTPENTTHDRFTWSAPEFGYDA